METTTSLYIISPLEKRSNRLLKRFFDLVISIFVLIFVFPWVYLFILYHIKTKMPGKVFFKQKRIGRNEQVFMCYKFRSMHEVQNADAPTDDDLRTTSFGHKIRVSGLDELPQFWNVLKGDMSVIGPRPHMLIHDTQYSEVVAGYAARHIVKPGITGWAQVNGYRGRVEKSEDIQKRVESDFWYIQNWTFKLDIIIMLRTFKVLFKKSR